MAIEVVNLEEGHPFAHEAVKRLEFHLRMAKGRNVKLLKLIHGYGSTGPGGKIKRAVHLQLKIRKERGEIKDYIPGEKLTIFEPETRKLLNSYPELSKDSDFVRNNMGITIVVL